MRIFLLGCLIVILACQKEEISCGDKNRVCSAEENFLFQKQKWENSGIDSYTMDFSIICFCIYRVPFGVSVKRNKVVAFTGNEDYCDIDCVMTIDQIFLEIQQLLERNPYSFEITYDPVYGFPAKSYFDLDRNLADEEIGYTIENFKVQ